MPIQTCPVCLQVVIVPDEVAAISAEVHAASESFDIVMTTGKFTPPCLVPSCYPLQVG